MDAIHPTRPLIGPDLAKPEDDIDDSGSVSSLEAGEILEHPMIAKRKGQHALLFKLSNEVLANIIKELDPVDQIISALTCHFMYDLIVDTNSLNNFIDFVPKIGGFIHVEEEEASDQELALSPRPTRDVHGPDVSSLLPQWRLCSGRLLLHPLGC